MAVWQYGAALAVCPLAVLQRVSITVVTVIVLAFVRQLVNPVCPVSASQYPGAVASLLMLWSVMWRILLRREC